MKLSMSVNRLSADATVPIEHRGRLQARICVSDSSFAKDVTLLADDRDEFSLDDITAMLHNFARHLAQPKAA